MYLKRIIKNNYKNWYNDDYIFEKVDGKYQSTKYGQFIESGLTIADYLLKKGYKNKRIMIISENSTKLMEFDFAISLFVGTVAIVSKEWHLEDLINGIKEIKPVCLLYSKKYENMVSNIKNNDIDYICMDDIKGKFNKDLFNLKIKNQNKPAKIVFSSGTTGKSKAVLLSLKNVYSGYNSLLRRCDITHNDSAYLFLPLNHTYANVYNFMFSLVAGYKLYLASSSTNIAQELLETNPTVFCAVPLVYNKLLDAYQDKIAYAFGKNIKWLFCGGAKISKETRQKYKDAGLFLMQAYALSETASSLTIAYPGNDDLESVGEIFEDITVKIDKPDKNGIGEIIVKGDNVFLGYTDKKLTAKVFDNEGFFHTGDLGYIKDKKIYLEGRIKKMLLTSNGENVMAESIENGIKNRSKNIKDVKAYIKDDKIVVDIYVQSDDNYDKIISEYNSNVPKYEQVFNYNIIKDSVDVRLKQ